MDLTKFASSYSTALISDVLDEAGHRSQTLPVGLRMLSPPAGPFIGRARTVLVRSLESHERFAPVAPEKRAAWIKKLEGTLRKDDIVVAELAGPVEAGLIGELYATFYAKLGVVGAVTNGFVRDVEALKKLKFGAVAAGTCPSNAFGRTRVDGFDGNVTIGGVAIRAGDIVFADADGSVVIPAEIFGSAAFQDKAKQASVGETETVQRLKEGEALSEIFLSVGRL